MKRILSLLLALTFLCGCTGALAALPESDDIQQSDYFQSYGMAVSAIGGGKLRLTFTCTSVGMADQLGVSTFCVQKKISSGHWEDVTDWVSGSTATNTTSHSFSKIFHGVAGETYRVKCTFVCIKTIDGNVGSEYKNYTSGQKTAT